MYVCSRSCIISPLRYVHFFGPYRSDAVRMQFMHRWWCTALDTVRDGRANYAPSRDLDVFFFAIRKLDVLCGCRRWMLFRRSSVKFWFVWMKLWEEKGWRCLKYCVCRTREMQNVLVIYLHRLLHLAYTRFYANFTCVTQLLIFCVDSWLVVIKFYWINQWEFE